jgi:hypothetical protein
MLFSLFFATTLLAEALAAIGPIASLHVINGVVSPDGFSRGAVLASEIPWVIPDGAASVGPLITARKVPFHFCDCHFFTYATLSGPNLLHQRHQLFAQFNLPSEYIYRQYTSSYND